MPIPVPMYLTAYGIPPKNRCYSRFPEPSHKHIQMRARARNGNPDAQPQDLIGLSQAQIREAVLQERNWELCFEGHCCRNLLRTDRYAEKLATQGIMVEARHQLYPMP